jgi:hypothetical protein
VYDNQTGTVCGVQVCRATSFPQTLAMHPMGYRSDTAAARLLAGMISATSVHVQTGLL